MFATVDVLRANNCKDPRLQWHPSDIENWPTISTKFLRHWYPYDTTDCSEFTNKFSTSLIRHRMKKITVNIQSRSDIAVTLKMTKDFDQLSTKLRRCCDVTDWSKITIGKKIRLNFDETAMLLQRLRLLKNCSKYLKL